MSKDKRDRKDNRKRGRPPLKFPEPIDDTPENITWAVLNTKPKKKGEWRFEKKKKAQE